MAVRDQIDAGFSGGILLPFQPNDGGGVKLVAGDDYLFQLITVLVSDGDSDNPFMRFGLGLDSIFANLSEDGWRAQQVRRVRDVFQDLERAQIARFVSMEFGVADGDGKATATIRYLSIETGQRAAVVTEIRRS